MSSAVHAYPKTINKFSAEPPADQCQYNCDEAQDERGHGWMRWIGFAQEPTDNEKQNYHKVGTAMP
jgi:hypothetical protein